MVLTTFHSLMRFRNLVSLALAMLLLWGCTTTPEPGVGEAVGWRQLEGWRDDRHAESWPALLKSCSKLAGDLEWTAICRAAEKMSGPSDGQAREFFERWFVPHEVNGTDGTNTGLITGYYEPLLSGSRQYSERYRYPVYGRPDDLIVVELADIYPDLKGKRLRGRLVGNKLVPYYNRASLDGDPELLRGHELLWVDDPIALFFLHVQGSGRVALPDGRILGVGYADQNGHPYHSIGRKLVAMGKLKKEDVTLFSIREWLRRNPSRIDALLGSNPSYIFFSERPVAGEGPYGSLNVPLVAERSIAVDPSVIPLGLPVWLETTLPDSGETYNRLMLAQDTGGAIKGPVRADVFWGLGDRAEHMAGLMKQSGRLYVLLPRKPEIAAE